MQDSPICDYTRTGEVIAKVKVKFKVMKQHEFTDARPLSIPLRPDDGSRSLLAPTLRT